ncbi:helix-turn-helix transcriptional regulator [Streptomyces sp. NPDC048506]|uniref:helix-turn-helix domain-containing protein n=1 Tax=Streptomyces sp. NPDC048506 TaxID=3155028 RepID=UPI00343BF7FC
MVAIKETSAKGKATPTVPRMLIGKRLAALRERAGLDLQAVADYLGMHAQTVRRLEAAEGGSFKIPNVARVLELYLGDDKEKVAAFLADVNAANSPQWWEVFNKDVVPPYLKRLLSLEEAAETIRGYAPQFIPDLLQTEEYTRAALQAQGIPPETVERRVDLNVLRQQRFHSGEGRRRFLEDKPQVLWLILDETALRRAVGGRQVMRAQLERLIGIAEAWEQKAAKASIRLLVLPHSAGPPLGMGEPCFLFRFRLHNLPDSVVRFTLEGGEYVEKGGIASAYLEALDRTNGRAIGFRDTPAFLREIQRDLWDG